MVFNIIVGQYLLINILHYVENYGENVVEPILSYSSVLKLNASMPNSVNFSDIIFLKKTALKSIL